MLAYSTHGDNVSKWYLFAGPIYKANPIKTEIKSATFKQKLHLPVVSFGLPISRRHLSLKAANAFIRSAVRSSPTAATVIELQLSPLTDCTDKLVTKLKDRDSTEMRLQFPITGVFFLHFSALKINNVVLELPSVYL